MVVGVINLNSKGPRQKVKSSKSDQTRKKSGEGSEIKGIYL